MKRTIAAALLLISGLGILRAQSNDESLSANQLRSLAKSLQGPDGRVYAIKLFPDASIGGRTAVAVLRSYASRGWQVEVYAAVEGMRFHQVWSSGKLADTFSVSSGSEMSIFELGSESAVRFGGCTPHMCSGIFSELLYVPSKKKSYSATCQDGAIHYSFQASDPHNSEIKSSLDQLLRERPGDENACGSKS